MARTTKKKAKLTRGSPQWWAVHVGAGVAATLLVLFGVQQCEQKESESKAKNIYRKELSNFVNRVDSLVSVNLGLVQENEDQTETIKELSQSLEDTQNKLRECEKGKRCVKKTVAPKPVVKAKPKGVISVKPRKKIMAAQQPQQTNVEKPVLNTQPVSEPVVNITSVQQAVKVNVQADKNTVTANNTNVSANTNVIVVGNNNNVTVNNAVNTTVSVAEAEKVAQQAATSYGYIKVKRVYRVK